MSTLLTALYIGEGGWTNAFIRRWQRSPYSHCEMVTEQLPDGRYACWSSSAQDDGVRRKDMELNPAHWELWQIPGDAQKVAAWFFAREGLDYDLLGLLGFAWRPWQGRRDKFWCSEACAAAWGIREPWRFDVALYGELVRLVGTRVLLPGQ